MNKSRTTLIFASLSLAMVAGTAAWACSAQPTISLTPRSLAAGDRLQVNTGQGFPGEVQIRWNDVNGQSLASGDGKNFSLSVQVPADSAPGIHYIMAVWGDSGHPAAKAVQAVKIVNPTGKAPLVVQTDLWKGFASSGRSLTQPGSANGFPSSAPNAAPLVLGAALATAGIAGLGLFVFTSTRKRARS